MCYTLRTLFRTGLILAVIVNPDSLGLIGSQLRPCGTGPETRSVGRGPARCLALLVHY